MRTITTALALILFIAADLATAGVLDPDCTAEKAAKGAAMKATVGVGGRCSPKEAAADTAKRATGISAPLASRTRGRSRSGATTTRVW